MMMNTAKPTVKTEEQIEGIRKSSVLAANTLKYAGKMIQPGMRSELLDALVYEYIKDAGATPATLGYGGFPASSCISVNEVVCHGIPDKREFRDGDIVKVDIATILDGYFGDNCATFAIGEVSDDAKKVMRVAEECLYKGIEVVKPDRHLNDIANAITRHAVSEGCSVVYEYAGHGVGLQFHEAPNVSHAAVRPRGPKMKSGWIFTIEPMINLGDPETLLNEADGWTVTTKDGSLSAQFEHTILLTDTGCEILTVADS